MECEMCTYLTTDLSNMNETVVSNWINATCDQDLFSNKTCSTITAKFDYFYPLLINLLKNEELCRLLGFCSRYIILRTFRIWD